MGGSPRAMALTVLFLTVGLATVTAAWSPAYAEATLVVHAEATGAPFPRGLLGTAHAPRSSDVAEAVAAAGVPEMRVDAYFDRASTAPGVFDWSGFDARLARVHASGAEPVLILAYTPHWLAACPSHDPAGPAHCPPVDLAAWADVVRAGVTRAAVDWDVRWFEVWNEPDHPGFWRGSLADYLALYAVTARTVQEVAAELDLPLKVGGPATLYPDLAWIEATLAHARVKSLPVDFVSFHWYADYPFHGPIGPLPGTVVTDSPLLHARTFGEAAARVRDLADANGFPDAEVWIDEWNANAGDAPRQRGAWGAAFVTAAVHAMHESGAVDRAHYFNVQEHAWGLFGDDGTPRPAWHAFRTLLTLGETVLPVDASGTPNAGALAARDADGTVRVIAFNLDAQAEVPARITVRAPAAVGASYMARTLDGAETERGVLDADGIALDVPSPGVRLVTLTPATG